MIRSAHLAALGVAFAVTTVPAAATASPPCARAGSESPGPPARQWPPPLDRVVSIHERGVSLRDALDRLAAAARLRLAYSAELLPLDRRVCVSHRSVAAGTVLAELLEGAAVEPVVTDSDRVVLTPKPDAAAASTPVATQR